MIITAKTKYGLKALLDIVYHHRAGPVQRRHIAARQGIPTDYMDQILMRLRSNGLIHSLRGREGGYLLAMSPDEITVWDVVCAVEDPGYQADGIEGDPLCRAAREIIADPVWSEVEAELKKKLQQKTFQSYLEDAEDRLLSQGVDPIVAMEMKPSPGWKLGPKKGKSRKSQVAVPQSLPQAHTSAFTSY